MTALTFHDRAKMSVASAPGTGNIALGSAVSGAQSFAISGVVDQETVSYVVEDGAAWEYGKAVYTASGTSLARTPTMTSAGNNTPLALSANAQVYITVLAEDLAAMYKIIAGSGGSGSDGGQTFTSWRILYGATQGPNNSNNQADIGQVLFFDTSGNPILTTGGTSISSSNYAAQFNNTHAFDGNAPSSGHPGWLAGNNAHAGEWIGYTFTSAQEVGSVKIYNYYGDVAGAPSLLEIDGSNDGATWTKVGSTHAAATWVDQTPQTFTVQTAAGAGGTGNGTTLERAFVPPPALSTFTQQNFDPTYTHAAAITSPSAGIMLNELKFSYGNTNALRALLVATPAAHYDLKTRLRRHSPLVQYSAWGLVLRDSVGGKSAIIGQAASDSGWGCLQLNSDTSFGQDFNLGGFRPGDYEYDFWLRLVNDATNFRIYMSRDGVYWTQLSYYNDSTMNSFFANAPNQIGFGYSPNNSDNNTVAADVTCFSWELASLS